MRATAIMLRSIVSRLIVATEQSRVELTLLPEFFSVSNTKSGGEMFSKIRLRKNTQIFSHDNLENELLKACVL